MRPFYNTEAEKYKEKGFGIRAFESRLRWQAHFIQKFEMECRMEHESINRGYHALNKTVRPDYVKAGRRKNRGAHGRCCYALFGSNRLPQLRMRALVVSFFVHQLWQP